MKNADTVQGCIHPHGENRVWNYRAYEHPGEEALHVDSSEMNWSYDPRQHLCHTCLFPPLSDLPWKSAGPSYNFQLDSVADSLLCSMHFFKLLLSKKNHSFPSLFYLSCMCCKGEALDFFFQFQYYRTNPVHAALLQGWPWRKAEAKLTCFIGQYTRCKWDFPGDSAAKNRREAQGTKFNPWVKKIPQRRKWRPTPIFLPGKSHGQRSPSGYSLWGHKEPDTAEWLNNKRDTSACLFSHGSGVRQEPPHWETTLLSIPDLRFSQPSDSGNEHPRQFLWEKTQWRRRTANPLWSQHHSSSPTSVLSLSLRLPTALFFETSCSRTHQEIQKTNLPIMLFTFSDHWEHESTDAFNYKAGKACVCMCLVAQSCPTLQPRGL